MKLKLTISMSRLCVMTSGSFLVMTSSTDIPLNRFNVLFAFLADSSASVFSFPSPFGGLPLFFPFAGVVGGAANQMFNKLSCKNIPYTVRMEKVVPGGWVESWWSCWGCSGYGSWCTERSVMILSSTGLSAYWVALTIWWYCGTCSAWYCWGLVWYLRKQKYKDNANYFKTYGNNQIFF